MIKKRIFFIKLPVPISSRTNASLAAANSNGVKLGGFIGYVEGEKNQPRIDKRIEKAHLKIDRLLKTQYWKGFILTARCCWADLPRRLIKNRYQ